MNHPLPLAGFLQPPLPVLTRSAAVRPGAGNRADPRWTAGRPEGAPVGVVRLDGTVVEAGCPGLAPTLTP